MVKDPYKTITRQCKARKNSMHQWESNPGPLHRHPSHVMKSKRSGIVLSFWLPRDCSYWCPYPFFISSLFTFKSLTPLLTLCTDSCRANLRLRSVYFLHSNKRICVCHFRTQVQVHIHVTHMLNELKWRSRQIKRIKKKTQTMLASQRRPRKRETWRPIKSLIP